MRGLVLDSLLSALSNKIPRSSCTYHEIVFERFYVTEELLDRVLLFVEGEKFRNLGVQAVHVLEHVLKNLVRFSGFLRERL